MLLSLAVFVSGLVTLSTATTSLKHNTRLDLIIDSMMQEHVQGPMGIPTWDFCNTTLTPVVIHNFTWSPLDFEPGMTLTGTIDATLMENVTGGKFLARMKVWGLPEAEWTWELCDFISKFNIQCPVAAGEWNLQETITLPNWYMKGKVDVHFEGYDQNGVQLGCLNVHVVF